MMRQFVAASDHDPSHPTDRSSHIEHHLFPRVCGIHSPALAPIVRRVAARHGVPYREHPTLGATLRSHIAALRAHGRRPEELSDDATLQGRGVRPGATQRG